MNVSHSSLIFIAFQPANIIIMKDVLKNDENQLNKAKTNHGFNSLKLHTYNNNLRIALNKEMLCSICFVNAIGQIVCKIST